MSTLESTTISKNTGYLDPTSKFSSVDFKFFMLHSLDRLAVNDRSAFGDVANTMPHRLEPNNIENTSMDDSVVLLSSSRSDVTFHSYRMADSHAFAATEIRHDTGARTHEWKGYGSTLSAAVTSSSLGSNGTTPEDRSLTDPFRSSSAPKRLLADMIQDVERQPDPVWLCEDTLYCPRELTPLVPPGLCAPCHHPVTTHGVHSPQELCEGRSQTGEILSRRAVIRVGATPAPAFEPTFVGYGGSTLTCPAPGSLVPSVTVCPFSIDEPLLEALADWTSEWLNKLVIRPHIQQGYQFQYHGKPNEISTWVARRLRHVLKPMYNPVQVAIHALWFIGILASDNTFKDTYGSFLSVPFFRHLHAQGTWTAEDFMFRAFVICATIGDKSVNDASLSTKTWNRLTRIPQATLDEAEIFTLKLLQWNAVMTHGQWQETIIYLRSCIKKSDPLGIMAHLLDELVTLSGADVADEAYQPVVQPRLEIIAPQPIRAFTQWQLYVPPEWCPEDDPIINKKTRTIGIAPGADQHSTFSKNGTTAKDLLDMILGGSGASDFAHLGRSAGTSFYGSFGAAHVAQTAKYTGAFTSNSWIAAQG